MKAGKVVAGVVAAIMAVVAFALFVGGGVLTWAHTTQRDADGFLESPTYDLETDGYALTTGDIDLGDRPGDWWPGNLADVRFEAQGTDDQAIFVGIAESEDVDGYLGEVSRDEVTHAGIASDVGYRSFSGGAPATPPSDQAFWAASTAGTGLQTLSWDVAPGEWSIVVMNADGSPAVNVELEAAANVGVLLAIGIGFLIFGSVVALLAAVLLVWAVRPARGAGGTPTTQPVPMTAPAGAYPLTLEGVLDEPLSRWKWLVKWLLALPHFVVLAFLWIAFFLLTIGAFFSILVTGRYPRNIFDFNVGVMRWTWRVSFYTYSALGTDKYPPFTLQDVDYPARLNVQYPQQLSRGLALVKWWLLAIPHYIVVALFTSGIVLWTTDLGGAKILEWSGGVIGILVFIAALGLLFTGRYSRGLFDLVIGLNRWVFRVMAYVTLMRDEYPPFRLDVGGLETGNGQPTPTPSSSPIAGE